VQPIRSMPVSFAGSYGREHRAAGAPWAPICRFRAKEEGGGRLSEAVWRPSVARHAHPARTREERGGRWGRLKGQDRRPTRFSGRAPDRRPPPPPARALRARRSKTLA
jgi:hypothetical protein